MSLNRIITVIKHPERVVLYIKRKICFIFTFDLIELFLSFKTIYELSKTEYKLKSVLIIEPNNFHGEILPGFCYYFNELGYQITLLVRRINYNNGLFDLFNQKELPKILCVNSILLKNCMKFVPKFDYIMMTSSIVGQKFGYYGFFFDYLGHMPKAKKACFVVEHNIWNLMPYIQNNEIDCRNVFLLTPLSFGDIKLSMLNPNYFCSVLKKKINKNIVTFITVGGIYQGGRNFDALLESVSHLKMDGFENFQVLVIGRGITNRVFTETISNVKILGEVNFEYLYQYLLQSDFFLPLLDPEDENGKKYLSGQTTGSRQLILGFNIIPLIQSEFARVYSFDHSNAIIYENSLLESMRRAMTLSEEERGAMEASLDLLMKKVRKESLMNLQKRIN